MLSLIVEKADRFNYILNVKSSFFILKLGLRKILYRSSNFSTKFFATEKLNKSEIGWLHISHLFPANVLNLNIFSRFRYVKDKHTCLFHHTSTINIHFYVYRNIIFRAKMLNFKIGAFSPIILFLWNCIKKDHRRFILIIDMPIQLFFSFSI